MSTPYSITPYLTQPVPVFGGWCISGPYWLWPKTTFNAPAIRDLSPLGGGPNTNPTSTNNLKGAPYRPPAQTRSKHPSGSSSVGISMDARGR